ncbi:MAG: phosphoribosyltransferase family protein [Porphyromonas sp.]|nr:phosphoribosyltransferase family protein [Porphyromonas sp.]
MENVIQVRDHLFEKYISEEQIIPEIRRIAREIEEDLGDKNPLFICILNGAFMFASDLSKEINMAHEMTFAKYSSYQGMQSTGILKEIMGPQAQVKGRYVVILEDLIDTGFTVTQLRKIYKDQGAKEVRVASMLSKPDALIEGALEPEYIGLEIPNDFIVGRGLDYNGVGRMLRDIYIIKE